MSAFSVPVLPESAPFSPAQRAWLNGFFAGLFRGGAAAAGSAAAVAPAPAPAEAEEEFPWHDPALPIDERLKLAEGKPTERVLMAAMAQLDCGACGYQCQTYGEAIARGEEKDLTRCAPGGKETARKLKELFARAPAAASPTQVRVKRSEAGWSRANPFPAPVVQASPLNKAGSVKDTRHVVFDLKGSGITYEPGDSLGVYPENCPDTVGWIIDALDAAGTEKVETPEGDLVPLRTALLKHYTVTTPSSELLALLAESATDEREATGLRTLAGDDGPGIPDGLEVFDLLKQFPSARPAVEQFAAALTPMRPRLYSISSSLRACPDQVHLTVGVVRFLNCRGRQCKGVASTYLSERVRTGQKVRLFTQKSHGFRLPATAGTPVLMIGPGTGVAPFRAFLQERKAAGDPGNNWLFFGDQTAECDFLYREELESYLSEGTLTRLSTAFSRDQERKIYVQHRMLEHAGEIWRWLQQGAHVYVCGDAKRMAADVDQALREIVAHQGGMSPEQAKSFVAELSKAGRYQRDVY